MIFMVSKSTSCFTLGSSTDSSQFLRKTLELAAAKRGVPQRSITSCETIHLALVVAGYNASRDVVVVIKSILFHRHSPIHFHFISDSKARSTLDLLLHTWSLPSVKYSFYQTEEIKPYVSWIPNSHYSGIFGLMKLLLPSVLLQIDKVIVLDTDITVVSNIHSLWVVFQQIIKGGKLIGLVENQSDWYLGTLWKNHKPWPALGRGFNTGVMLMNLSAMRKCNWSKMWQIITNDTLQTHKYTSLADQDIINTVIKNHEDIVYRLPCTWNVQLSENTRSDECYLNNNEYHIVHWNSPLKLATRNENSPYFRDLYYTFEEYDGNLLHHGLIKCKDISTTAEKPYQSSFQGSNDTCSKFFEESKKFYRTHLYFYGSQYHSTDPFDVTLVSQLSIDRLQTLEIILKHWIGPVSLAVYATDYEAWQVIQYLGSLKIAHKQKMLAVHIVYKQGHLYPVNHLRNTALNAANTPFVFLCDIDFVPMFRLYTYLREAVRVLKPGQKKRALVVPAFETLLYKFSYPNDKQTLVSQMNEGKLEIFRKSVWEEGHAATNYNKWFTSEHPYKIHWMPNFEPYIVVANNVSRFDERFLGFGWNKVSHIIQLDAEDYEFVVLPHAFMIHLPHAPSSDIARYRGSKRYRECQKNIKQKFIKDLLVKYGDKANKYLSGTSS